MPTAQQSTIIHIGNSQIGNGHPTYMVAEMSANHGGDFERAVDIIHAAKDAGADAVKMQTYTADTLTLDSRNPPFHIDKGPWAGQTLHQLYETSYTPWEWQPRLKEVADRIGIPLFSTPFDMTAVDFLEGIDVPAYKIASYEIIETPLLERVAKTGKPIILSTGKATLAEIDEAVRIVRHNGAREVVLLKCTSAYPAPPEEMNLKTIQHLQECFGLPVGLSDHSLGIGAAIAAVTMGACMIEKHFILDQSRQTPDSFFSLTASEFKLLVREVRAVERSIGNVHYASQPDESRRGLWAIKNIGAGERITEKNTRSLRPGGGLVPCFFVVIEGRRARFDIKRGTPIVWSYIE